MESAPRPEPAVPAILTAFERYDVIGMPEAHGMKDLDDVIYSPIRNPAFAEEVNELQSNAATRCAVKPIIPDARVAAGFADAEQILQIRFMDTVV
jgi:hypothetical protein